MHLALVKEALPFDESGFLPCPRAWRNLHELIENPLIVGNTRRHGDRGGLVKGNGRTYSKRARTKPSCEYLHLEMLCDRYRDGLPWTTAI